jgi:TPR repeat protein
MVARSVMRVVRHVSVGLTLALAAFPAAADIRLPLAGVDARQLPLACFPSSGDAPKRSQRKQEDRESFCKDWARLVLGPMEAETSRRYEECIETLFIENDEAFELSLHVACRKVAETRADGAFELGRHFDFGEGVAQSGFKAEQWYLRAAEAGDARAFASLGLLYTGVGPMPKNPHQSLRWYLKAAEAGDARAMFSVGDAYASGDAVPRNYATAAFWYGKSIEGGYFLAPYALARLYESGKGVRKDPIEAYAWNSLSASTGNIMAMSYLDALEKTMSSAQIAEAQRRATALDALHGDRIRAW